MTIKQYKEEVNKQFNDIVIKKVNEAVKNYFSKLKFFFGKGEKLGLNYDKGGFRPTSFYLMHNTIDPMDPRTKKISFINKNGKWDYVKDGPYANFAVNVEKNIGDKKQAFFDDILKAVKEGMSEYSKIMVKNKQARNYRINSRNEEGANTNNRLQFESVNYFPY